MRLLFTVGRTGATLGRSYECAQLKFDLTGSSRASSKAINAALLPAPHRLGDKLFTCGTASKQVAKAVAICVLKYIPSKRGRTSKEGEQQKHPPQNKSRTHAENTRQSQTGLANHNQDCQWGDPSGLYQVVPGYLGGEGCKIHCFEAGGHRKREAEQPTSEGDEQTSE
jgi:hypothetical protein